MVPTRCPTAQSSADCAAWPLRLHRGKGWEQVTQRAIEALVARGGPLVAILWGRDASLIPMLGSVPYLASAHPSPLSAAAGFFGSRPFSRANELLVRAGGRAGRLGSQRNSRDFASRAMRKGLVWRSLPGRCRMGLCPNRDRDPRHPRCRRWPDQVASHLQLVPATERCVILPGCSIKDSTPPGLPQDDHWVRSHTWCRLGATDHTEADHAAVPAHLPLRKVMSWMGI